MSPTAYVCPVYDEKKIGAEWHEFITHYGIFLVNDGNPNGVNNPENLHALYPDRKSVV